ncbi:helix-turn-helix domain-containing protein [Rubrolithibacter danxiaensis]|uniref:helix-turn-helix domain-containing protein n=1 Tax=Rubrolithibacter danxiaensis TaxID=3390805 RepID=UPI003BF7B059
MDQFAEQNRLHNVERMLMELLQKVNEKEKKAKDKKRNLFKKAWLTSQEVMFLLDISERTLTKWRSEKILVYSQIKGKSYYKSKDLKDLLKRNYGKTEGL